MQTWKLFVLGTLLACGAQANAQDLTTRRPIPPRPPQIWLDPSQGKLQPIQLQDVAIDVKVHGFMASTTMELSFFNPNGRVLEGELVFPLADGQSVSGYALEVNGALRQGVVVEKETARVAYEATTRGGIDPGLAELTQGNVFRTRLYPIPAHGIKRVSVSFDQPLLDVANQWRYVLPLQFAQTIRDFRVNAQVLRGDMPATGDAASGALDFTQWQNNYVAKLARHDYRPERELSFAIPKPAQAGTIFAVQDMLDPSWRTFTAQVPATQPSRPAPAAPHRIALYYDASGSAQGRDRPRELDALTAWLSQLGNVQVDLIAFRNDADPARSFPIRNGDTRALRQAIEALPLDGGSSYGAIRPDANTHPDLVLVMGDGLSNFGTSEPQLDQASGTSPRVMVLHAAQMADGAALSRLALAHDGQVVNLLQTTQDDSLRELNHLPWLLQQVRVVSGECRDLTPALPTSAENAIVISGRCHGQATLDLTFGDAAGATAHQQLRIDDTSLLDPAEGDFVQRAWANARIADLQATAHPDDAAITALAKRYGIVTTNTSMLVLDRIEDYVHYGVEPREPELLAQYRQWQATHPKTNTTQDTEQAHREQVAKQWADFRQWHDEQHPWLETVLVPTADAEIVRWRALDSHKQTQVALAEAKAIATQAHALQQHWLKDGASDATRKPWEHSASLLMLKLDALRMQRLALAPDSDNVDASMASHESARRQATPVPSVVESSASPMPPPPPAQPSMPAPAPMMSAMAEPMAGLQVADAAHKAASTRPADAGTGTGTGTASIQLQPATSDKPYMARLRAAADPYTAYLSEREAYAKSPSFYLDCADYLRDKAKQPRLALRVLSNLAEIDIDNAPLLRILAYRLEQWERFELAVPLFEQALHLRGEEPQSYRDLGLALSRQPTPDYARASQLLWHVVDHAWDARFPEVETIALHELNDVLMRAPANERAALTQQLAHDGASDDMLKPLPVQLRVALTWDADNTDVDLWVIDPTGEVAIYSHNRTQIGGHLSRDFTQGYGPEVYTIHRPIPGTYIVKAHYFGNHQQKLAGDVTVQAEFLTQFDTGESKRMATTRRLEDQKELIEIGRFQVGAP
ncbi:VIT domain-containing protein [Dyella sp.]|uniref:VIT domain-containing protein n=1 Tax=Dyella sp. TaxID=1869338 RepID=UPI0028453486|nr:VIT domain-containing protein [Dyella sp.]MDR3444967.1 VIT domain-containing protein [Dyella sp.]